MLIRERRLQELHRSDVAITIGGDVFTEDYGILAYYSQIFIHWFPLLLDKPLVIYAETVGPFRGKLPILITKLFFNKVKLITLREEASEKELQKLGIKTPIYVTSDSAFLLEPPSHQEVKKILAKEDITEDMRTLIGMSVVEGICPFDVLDLKDPVERYSRCVGLMAQVVDYLIDDLNATVVFIAHSTEPWHADDRVAAEDICRLIKNKAKIRSIKSEYTAEEIKGIIGECDLFVGARMHSLIASTSMNVPTVAIAYSRKTREIIGKMLGQERYVLEINELDYAVLTSTIRDAWNHREEIRKDLAPKIKVMKERAWLNGKLVRDLLDCST